MVLFRILSLLALLQFLSCQNESSDDTKEDEYQPEILRVAHMAGEDKEFDAIFNDVKVQPLFGGPYFSITAISDMVVTDEKVLIAVRGDSPSLHIYERGQYTRSFIGVSEGPENAIDGISSFVLDKQGNIVIVDRNGLEIIHLDGDLKVSKRVFTNLYSWDLILLQDGYLVNNGSEITDNTGRLTRLDSDGGIVENYMPITEQNDHINFMRFNVLNRFSSGDVIYHEAYDPVIRTYVDDTLRDKYIVDLGSKGVPADYFEGSFANVMEFIEPLCNSDYWHGIENFIETPQWIAFSLLQGRNDHKLVLLDKEDDFSTVAVIRDLTYENLLPNIRLSNHYLHGPLGVTSAGYLYWLIPEEEINTEARKKILSQPFLALSLEENESLLDKWEEEYRLSVVFAK